jgi:hypothetical protein
MKEGKKEREGERDGRNHQCYVLPYFLSLFKK